MWRSDETEEPIQRPDRPVGVTVLTILDGLVAGIMPAIGTAVVVMRGDYDTGDPLTLIGLCISVSLSIAILMASIGAYRGSDPGRLALLFLLVLHSSLQVFQTLSGSIAGQPSPGSFGRSLLLLALMAINTWYFLRPTTIAYYRRPVETTRKPPAGN